MDFNKIIGQKEIVNRLIKTIIDNRIGHAYIFTGTKGIGKRTIGRAFAHMLLCNMPDSNGPCNKCASCRLRIEGSNPDFYQIETDGDNISIDEIRNMQNDILIKPLYSNRKVVLIVDAEKLTVQAQNCLLKVLEEPPHYAVIILTASNYKALLGTIRSRVSKFNLTKYSPEEMREIIKHYAQSDTPDKDFIINYSDGIPGIAINLVASDDFIILREKAIDIIRKLDNMKDIEFFDIYDFFETNKNKIDIVLDVMTTFYRDLIVIKTGGKENMLINSDKKNKIVNEAGKYSIEKLINNIEVVETTRNSIKQNINYQLSIETMILKLQS